MDERDRKRIIELTMQIVAGQIEKGEVDPADEKALRETTKKAAALARTAYFAALEYVGG